MGKLSSNASLRPATMSQNILEQDAFTLEDLLEEDDLIQECKSQFPKVNGY